MASRRLVGQITRPDKSHLDGNTINDRDRVPVGLRQWGMFFTVFNDANVDNNTTWVLVNGLVDASKSNNNNWQTIKEWLAAVGVGVNPDNFRFASFDGDAVETEFTIDIDVDVPAHILQVYVGGQLLREGTHYTKDDETKTVTILFVPDAGQGIEVFYYATHVRVFGPEFGPEFA